MPLDAHILDKPLEPFCQHEYDRSLHIARPHLHLLRTPNCPKKEGYVQIASLFEETANNEKEHAKIWFKLFHDCIPDTATNLLLFIFMFGINAVLND